jgi:hypothetical protein
MVSKVEDLSHLIKKVEAGIAGLMNHSNHSHAQGCHVC